MISRQAYHFLSSRPWKKLLVSNYIRSSAAAGPHHCNTSTSALLISRSIHSKMASKEDIDMWYETAVQLAEKAGELIAGAVKKSKRVETKCSFADLVTETDKEVEELLRKNLQETFPDHKFIGEESISDGEKCELTDAPTWIIDPIDGTMNFVHSFPYVAVSIGLAVKKEIVVGIIYSPLLNRMYTAKKGEGAYCNGKKIHVSSTEELSQSLILAEFGTTRDAARMQLTSNNILKFAWKAHGMRSLGCCSLAMASVASGEAEAYFETGIHCWDMAAGALLMQEAGGVVLDTEGGPLDIMNRRLLCANSKKIADILSKDLQHLQLERD